MRLLLDECVDRRLSRSITGHFVSTVSAQRWAGLSDRRLLERAQSDFDVLVTADQNLPKQNQVSAHNIAVVVLRSPTNRLADLEILIPELLARLESLRAGDVLTIPQTSGA